MISQKKQIQQLSGLLIAKGIRQVIISPGSRNGPMIHTFYGNKKFLCRVITDERSAAYFAMGIAQQTGEPVVLTCSSGTATLNYAPAVAEAFYQNVPLIVLTGDRPQYWIGQLENQCIPQNDIYRNFVKKEISLPVGESENELWSAGRDINECLNLSVSGIPAPVHINIPFEEPLHEFINEELPKVKVIEESSVSMRLESESLQELKNLYNKSDKILILTGQQSPDSKLESILRKLSEKTGAIVLKEHLANINGPYFCSSIDNIMSSFTEQDKKFCPDLLITCGRQIVSKTLKQFLRKNPPAEHWHLNLSGAHNDTYKCLTRVIRMKSSEFFNQIIPYVDSKDKVYFNSWKDREQKVNRSRDYFIKNIPFCDLKVYDIIRQYIPEQSVIHLGNSSPVRYSLICDPVKKALYYSNRGTSGIDGCMSTAAGYASSSDLINTLIIGDLSFFYDSNALWNKYIGKNLRIILIHNGGGNIFGLIKGPSLSPAFEDCFFTDNEKNASGIAKTFDLDYLQAKDENSLKESMQVLYNKGRSRPAILEIFTNADVNYLYYRKLFEQIKNKKYE